MSHSAWVEVKGHLWELFLSLHLVGLRDNAQVVSLGSEHLYLLRHSVGSILFLVSDEKLRKAEQSC